ncbi:MAG: beta-ketoacyl-ACP synthase III [Crocosphaera sp.]|nr:beta-ketoacyl-ACP synthase III [Crocosphaera sp.]
MKEIGIGITGCGSATPQQVMSNDDLSHLVDTSDEWIRTRTGIRKRHLATNELSLSDLSTQAAAQAIEMAGLTPADIDLILLATSTPDDLFGTATQIQTMLGANNAVAFDLTAACSGFVFALITASQFIRTGVYKRVVVIGADILSRWVDWSDRTTCVLFGDGAGAVVCQGIEAQDHLLGFTMYSDGKQHEALSLNYQGQTQSLTENLTIAQGTYQPIFMQGRDIYRFAVEKVPEVIEKAVFKADLTIDDLHWVILHQANQRIIDAVAKRLKISSEKMISNLDEYGNTSAASIPLALDEAVRSGKIKPGDIVATAGFGAGLTWGAAIFRWGL